MCDKSDEKQKLFDGIDLPDAVKKGILTFLEKKERFTELPTLVTKAQAETYGIVIDNTNFALYEKIDDEGTPT